MAETKETLVETITRKIKLDIVGQELQPGQRIQAKELAKKYGTSETPVKLALNRLISEQVVEDFPRQGMRIKSMSEEDAIEIFNLRLMMDLYYTKEIIEAVQMNKQAEKCTYGECQSSSGRNQTVCGSQ